MDFIEYYSDHVRVREATKKGYAIAKVGDSINLEQPNSKTRRGRVGKGICNTLTTSCNQGVVVDMNEIIRVGQVSNKGSQAGMVYDVEGVFPTVCACTHGYAIGNIADNKLIHKGVDCMWNNNLEKFNFEMEEIRIADFFSGIGALHQALKELGVPVGVTNLSEIDIDATISYAAVHIDNFKDLEFEYPSTEEMRQWLIDRNIGYSYEKDKSSVPRMKVDKLKLAYKASVLLNNLGDISKIDYHRMEDFDMFNLSFSCTDLSNSGKQRGMKNPDGTPTRSGLYVYGIEAVRVKKPKYIMIENVKGLIQKKFIDDFYSIISELEEMGYNCYYPTKEDKKGNKLPVCLNSKDFGIPQNRQRIFVIAIRKDIDNHNFEFPIGKDYGIRLKDVLENQVNEKYYLSDEIQKKFKTTNHNPEMVLTNGAIRGRYNSEGKIEQQLELRNDGVTNTLTTVEKDNVILENPTVDYRIRKLTPLECWRLQGFRDESFYKAQELGVSDSQLYKEAGNSITVNVLYYIFKNLFKEYITK